MLALLLFTWGLGTKLSYSLSVSRNLGASSYSTEPEEIVYAMLSGRDDMANRLNPYKAIRWGV